ncbi:MAG: hypothetical protein AAGE43_00890 [Pseudomonadota bacterium]
MWDIFFRHPRTAYEAGEFVLTNVTEPVWWWLSATVVSMLLLASVLSGRHTRGWRLSQKLVIGTLQVSVALGVIGLLAGPGLKLMKLEAGVNSIAVLIDRSGSMSFPASAEPSGKSRLDLALAQTRNELLPLLNGLGEVALFSFDTAARREESVENVRPDSANTHLVEAADTVLASFSGAPLAGLVLLSDGADNDTLGALEIAGLSRHGVPIHTVGFGPDQLPGEVELKTVTLPTDAPPGSKVVARAVIQHDSASEAVLKVRSGGTLIAMEPITLPRDEPTVRAELILDAGEAGIRELSFEIEAESGDRLAENNRIERLLTVSERKRRVLYLEGEPRWEYKFLRRAVADDEVLELVSWLKTTDRKTYRQGVDDAAELADGFTASKAELFSYDVVILGSLDATELSAEQHAWLEAFVAERGGSVLTLAGRHALADGRWDVQPLARALPVKLERAESASYEALKGSAQPTRLGVDSPFTQLVDAEGGNGWLSLPALGDLQHLGELKPAASVLLEFVSDDERYPLLVTQPYGLGTTAVLATASTWRWRMRTPPDDPRHALFWRQLLRQLAETAQQQRTVNLALEEGGINIRARLRDENFEPALDLGATATITGANRQATTIALTPGPVAGQLAGRFVPGEAGVYRVDVGLDGPDGNRETITRFLRAGSEAREAFNPTRNSALLSRIAETTGGRYFADGDLEALPELLSFGGTGVKRMEILPLWNLPVLFLALLLLKLLEWMLRRSWGRI